MGIGQGVPSWNDGGRTLLREYFVDISAGNGTHPDGVNISTIISRSQYTVFQTVKVERQHKMRLELLLILTLCVFGPFFREHQKFGRQLQFWPIPQIWRSSVRSYEPSGIETMKWNRPE